MSFLSKHLTTSQTSPDHSQRASIASDTIARTDAVTEEHAAQGATTDSTFIPEQLPPLDPSACPNVASSEIQVINADSFTAARNIMRKAPAARASTAVLNLASDELPGGGWKYSLSKTQEEALCYSSTLYATLKEPYYPWPNLGPGSVAGIYSPGVVVFKDDLDHGCVDLPPTQCRVLSVITVAAPCGPKLTDNGEGFKKESDLNDLRGKIRLVYRMAAHNGQQYLVLAAMGCGAYRCPPRLVAEEMKSILLEAEFKGWFRQIVFAIYSRPTNGPGNFEVFRQVLHGVKV